MEFSKDYPTDELLGLLDACHRILPTLDDEDDIAQLLRQVCEAVEARVNELSRPLSELAAEPR